MDPLLADDIVEAHRTPPAERLRQALALMAQGIAIKRTSLRRRFPGESETEIEVRLLRWLGREDD